jgi:hypothetical protein
VANVEFVSDDVLWLSWKLTAEEHVPNLRHTNEVIGAKITEDDRIHLYGFIGLLRENAI